MKRSEFLKFCEVILNITKKISDKLPSECSLGIAYNKKILFPIAELLQEEINNIKKDLPKNSEIYEIERQKLVSEYSMKDANGNIVKMQHGDREYISIQNVNEFNIKITELNDKFKEEIIIIEKVNKNLNEFLNKEMEDLKIYKIKKTDLPTQIEISIVEELLPMIQID